MDKTGNNDQKQNNEEKPKVENDWMIRQCAVYDEEYSDCTSIRARFHQYFIHGKSIDCSQWKRDSLNCYKWEENQDIKAANEIIQSEKQRRRDRLVPHYSNDVWKKRKSPPSNWNDPLPDYIKQDYEASYLNIKSKEMSGELPPTFDINHRCSIL